ncbi:hypothetical protein [Gordonia sp. WA4-43]|uniref:hypothetical protein n=1 Tax=Gordonia sp. WA4-43 TaxID=2878678 RepID=UPI001CFC3A49|nr:hypothetical protein [Gordonia sp. WA4-43]UCZ88633.1 hypothetical protein LEL84_16305 [Gordonia sp. WA4-43]
MTDQTTPEQHLRQLAAIIETATQQALAIIGHPATHSAPHHLDAMAEAYDEGYNEGQRPDAVPHNPYRKLLDDRREFVRDRVENGYGTMVYPPTSDTAYDDCENVLGDDNAEWFDAVLDAHDEWLALQAGKK